MTPSTKTITKLLIQKGLPEAIIYKIIRLFYREEHQWRLKRCFEDIINKAFRSQGVCLADIESAVMWYYQCNCCERHSYNKAVIRDDDLMIVTKPCVFKGWRYDTDQHQCRCNCRNKGRMLARDFLERKNPAKPYLMMPPVNGTHRPVSLGIRGALEIQHFQQHGIHDNDGPDPDDNGGPDPDDPAYYDYMVEHFPHLVNH